MSHPNRRQEYLERERARRRLLRSRPAVIVAWATAIAYGALWILFAVLVFPLMHDDEEMPVAVALVALMFVPLVAWVGFEITLGIVTRLLAARGRANGPAGAGESDDDDPLERDVVRDLIGKLDSQTRADIYRRAYAVAWKKPLVRWTFIGPLLGLLVVLLVRTLGLGLSADPDTDRFYDTLYMLGIVAKGIVLMYHCFIAKKEMKRAMIEMLISGKV